jgi:hypothetical protein
MAVALANSAKWWRKLEAANAVYRNVAR